MDIAGYLHRLNYSGPQAPTFETLCALHRAHLLAVPSPLADYVPMCRYHQTSPESIFTQRRICSLATTDGRVTRRSCANALG